MCLGDIDGDLLLAQLGEVDGLVGAGDLHAVAHEVAGQDGQSLGADVARADLTGPVEVDVGVDVHVVELGGVGLAGAEEGQVGRVENVLDAADGGDVVDGGGDLVHLAVVALGALEVLEDQLFLHIVGELYVAEVDAAHAGLGGGGHNVDRGAALAVARGRGPGVEVDVRADGLQVGLRGGGEDRVAGGGGAGDAVNGDGVLLHHGGGQIGQGLTADRLLRLVGGGLGGGDHAVLHGDGDGDGLIQTGGGGAAGVGIGGGAAAEQKRCGQEKCEGKFQLFHDDIPSFFLYYSKSGACRDFLKHILTQIAAPVNDGRQQNAGQLPRVFHMRNQALSSPRRAFVSTATARLSARASRSDAAKQGSA